MADTVRFKIEQAIIAAIAGLSTVAAAAVLADGEAIGDAEGGAILEGTKAGKHGVEITFFPDEVYTEGEQRQKLTLKEQWSFAVSCVIHLGVQPGNEVRRLAEDARAAVYGLSVAQPGDWNLAIRTDALGGGGVFVTELGTRATAVVLEVVYRHGRGDPTAAG